MTERELQNSILGAIKSHKDANNGAQIPFQTLASQMGMSEADLQKALRALKMLDCVRFTEDDKTFVPVLVDITINGKNRLK